MANNQYTNRNPDIKKLNGELFHAPSLLCEVGDLVYWDAGQLNYKPASVFPDQGSAALTQLAFAKVFLGVSAGAQLATDTTARQGVIWTDLEYDYPVPASSNFLLGDYVGPVYTAGVLADQQLIKVAGRHLAVGRVIKNYPAVVPTYATAPYPYAQYPQGNLAKVRISSRYLIGINDTFTLGLGQGLGLSTLTDDAAAVTVDLGPFLSITPSAPRSKNLPSEAASAGLEFYVTNLAAAVTVTFLSSTGTAIKGNGAVPGGKTAKLWCDGVNWSGLVSA